MTKLDRLLAEIETATAALVAHEDAAKALRARLSTLRKQVRALCVGDDEPRHTLAIAEVVSVLENAGPLRTADVAARLDIGKQAAALRLSRAVSADAILRLRRGVYVAVPTTT